MGGIYCSYEYSAQIGRDPVAVLCVLLLCMLLCAFEKLVVGGSMAVTNQREQVHIFISDTRVSFFSPVVFWPFI